MIEKKILGEKKSTFDKYFKDDTNNSKDNNYAHFDKYSLDLDKSSNYEDEAISQRNDRCFYEI